MSRYIMDDQQLLAEQKPIPSSAIPSSTTSATPARTSRSATRARPRALLTKKSSQQSPAHPPRLTRAERAEWRAAAKQTDSAEPASVAASLAAVRKEKANINNDDDAMNDNDDDALNDNEGKKVNDFLDAFYGESDSEDEGDDLEGGKSRRNGRKSRRNGRKSRRNGRKSRRGGLGPPPAQGQAAFNQRDAAHKKKYAELKNIVNELNNQSTAPAAERDWQNCARAQFDKRTPGRMRTCRTGWRGRMIIPKHVKAKLSWTDNFDSKLNKFSTDYKTLYGIMGDLKNINIERQRLGDFKYGGGRKSRRGGRKSRRGGRKSRRGGRKSRRGY